MLKRCLGIVAILALLALPVVGWADEETFIPPELNYNATPPAGESAEALLAKRVGQVMEGVVQELVQKGVFTPQDQAEIQKEVEHRLGLYEE